MSAQINNPLHGITLQNLLNELVDVYGWEYLAEQVEVRCFMFDPSIKSSLKFLRKTQWARDKVEAIYLSMLEEKAESKSDASVDSSGNDSVKSKIDVEDPWAQSLNSLQGKSSNDNS